MNTGTSLKMGVNNSTPREGTVHSNGLPISTPSTTFSNVHMSPDHKRPISPPWSRKRVLQQAAAASDWETVDVDDSLLQARTSKRFKLQTQVPVTITASAVKPISYIKRDQDTSPRLSTVINPNLTQPQASTMNGTTLSSAQIKKRLVLSEQAKDIAVDHTNIKKEDLAGLQAGWALGGRTQVEGPVLSFGNQIKHMSSSSDSIGNEHLQATIPDQPQPQSSSLPVDARASSVNPKVEQINGISSKGGDERSEVADTFSDLTNGDSSEEALVNRLSEMHSAALKEQRPVLATGTSAFSHKHQRNTGANDSARYLMLQEQQASQERSRRLREEATARKNGQAIQMESDRRSHTDSDSDDRSSRSGSSNSSDGGNASNSDDAVSSLFSGDDDVDAAAMDAMLDVAQDHVQRRDGRFQQVAEEDLRYDLMYLLCYESTNCRSEHVVIGKIHMLSTLHLALQQSTGVPKTDIVQIQFLTFKRKQNTERSFLRILPSCTRSTTPHRRHNSSVPTDLVKLRSAEVPSTGSLVRDPAIIVTDPVLRDRRRQPLLPAPTVRVIMIRSPRASILRCPVRRPCPTGRCPVSICWLQKQDKTGNQHYRISCKRKKKKCARPTMHA